MSNAIIHTAQATRQLALQLVDSVPEELFDIQPRAFNNTIRWNVGHLVYWADAYRTLCFAAGTAIPGSYASFFNSGTKPADWTEAPPSKTELAGHLTRQYDAIAGIDPVSLDRPLASPLQMGPLGFRTAGELFNFAVVHEASHLAVCSSLLKVIRHES